jgi:hypothetical protein
MIMLSGLTDRAWHHHRNGPTGGIAARQAVTVDIFRMREQPLNRQLPLWQLGRGTLGQRTNAHNFDSNHDVDSPKRVGGHPQAHMLAITGEGGDCMPQL